jgi:LPXTG-site transpeptidase (sortase) family protein
MSASADDRRDLRIGRRRLLKSAAAVAIVGPAVAVVGDSQPAEAASAIGTVSASRLWGTRSVAQKTPDSPRPTYVRVAQTKRLYEGTEKSTLNKGGLCHWPGTPKLFENGNCVLFGHRTSAGGPLRKLNQMRVGDLLTFTVGARTVTYRVTVAPRVIGGNDFFSVVDYGDGTSPALTLVACSKKNKLPTSTKYRLIVRAEAV